MHDIFLSYSRKDNDIMQRVKQSFLDAGLTVWTDEGIQPGTPSWQDAIENAIQETQAIVCLLSPDAKNSRWVRAELQRAEWYKKPIFLILVAGQEHESIPMGYEFHQYTDIRELSEYETRLVQLIQSLSRVLKSLHISRSINSLQSPVQEAQQLAHDFNGTQNSDWTPIITQLGKIIPDTPMPEIEMCLVPVGKFMMGDENGNDDEKPVHQQNIVEPYWIGRYPITNAQWQYAVVAKIVNQPQGDNAIRWYNDNQMVNTPVVGVNWIECLRFVQWIKCALPTEPLWEYAARGIENWIYPWGDSWDDNKCVYDRNSGGKPNPVTSKSNGASWIGAIHMSGNIWEWQLNEYKDYPYVMNYKNETEYEQDETILRSLRGGSYFSSKYDSRSVSRRYRLPYPMNDLYGLRVTCSLRPKSSIIKL